MAAASIDELQRMIRSFRITELQVLLGYVGKQKTGKKQELLERALSLLRNPTFSIMSKIRELHSQRIHRSNVNSALTQRPSPPITAYNRDTDTSNIYNNGVVIDNHSVESHPDLSLVVLPFYDHMYQILPPTLLRQTSFSGRYQETAIQFQLSAQHSREIENNRSVNSDGVYISDVQVQLRFASADKQMNDIQDMYPPCLVLRLNGKMVQLPNPIPTNKPNADPKRPPRPLDLTWLCRNSPIQNTLVISWALPNEPDLPKTYCYTINLVKKRSSEYLTQKVISRGIRPKSQTESLIKAKLSDEEDDIALTSLKVSLLCPLGKMRMTLPCCSLTCDHIQCFDVTLYLMMNEKKPTWTCPVCDQPAKFKDLLIDELFADICKVAGDCDEILFSPDGTWAPFNNSTKDPQSIHQPVNGIRQSNTHNSTKKDSDPPPKEKAPVDIIVLSDSEDESDNGSSIQPVRPNKRPLSTLSSDSSLGLDNSTPSRLRSPSTNCSSQKVPSVSNPVPSILSQQTKPALTIPDTPFNPPLSSYGYRESQSNYGLQSSLPYPQFMPSDFMDYRSMPSTMTSHTSFLGLSSLPTTNTLSLDPQLPEPSIIDFSQPRYSDSPTLDDSDIIPLD